MREHLRAGYTERTTGRAHHSSKIEGYLGESGPVMHGQRYPGREGVWDVEEIHGITDGKIDGPDHAAALKRQKAAQERIAKDKSQITRPNPGDQYAYRFPQAPSRRRI